MAAFIAQECSRVLHVRCPVSTVVNFSRLLQRNCAPLSNVIFQQQYSRSFFSSPGQVSKHCFHPMHRGIFSQGSPPLLVQPCQRRLGCLYSTSSQPSEPAKTQTTDHREVDDKLYKWMELKVKGHDDAVLESYGRYVNMAASELDIHVDSITKPFRDIKRLTLLKSRHVYKKHRVQYEMRTYYRVIKVKHLTGSTADVFLEYIERNLPEGVAMQVKKCSIEKLPSQLQSPPEQLENDLELSSSSESSSDSSSDEEEGASAK